MRIAFPSDVYGQVKKVFEISESEGRLGVLLLTEHYDVLHLNLLPAMDSRNPQAVLRSALRQAECARFILVCVGTVEGLLPFAEECIKLGEILGIECADFIVLHDGKYTSMSEEGLFITRDYYRRLLGGRK